ncbi:MAG: radical SAM protein [Thermodesulfobacteriota bacterium]|nr:radical SAM protein [Thermodesulfobacteriota bacterium]
MINNIAIDITNYCNFDCIHCLRDKLSPRAHMQTELLEFVLREVASVGIREVCLTGGEPALHPDLKRIFKLIVEYGMRFSLVSNAFLFEEKILPLIDSAVREHFSGICFSLDGATADSHDMLRREGSFEKVIKAIDVCVKENIPLSVKSIVHKENINDITDVACLCASKGVGSLGFVLLTPTPRLISEELMPSPQEYMDVTKYIKGRIIPSFSMVINIEGYADPDYKVSFCNPAQGISIDHEGNFIFCCNLSHPIAGDRPDTFGREFLGNIKEIGIEEGIIRHYRTFAWFMEKVIDSNLEGRQIKNCVSCFKLFDKMDWIKEYESPYN